MSELPEPEEMVDRLDLNDASEGVRHDRLVELRVQYRNVGELLQATSADLDGAMDSRGAFPLGFHEWAHETRMKMAEYGRWMEAVSNELDDRVKEVREEARQ